MPRLPGKKSTRDTFKVEDLVIGSFIMDHEVWAWRRPCVVEGCEHRMGPDATKPGWTDWESCDKNHLPAHAARDDERSGFPNAGPVCPCHVGQILARD